MATGMSLQKEAVACGYWPLYHFDPREAAHPFQLDSKKPAGDFKDFAMKEARFAMFARSKPEASARLLVWASRHRRALALLRAVGRRDRRRGESRRTAATAPASARQGGEIMSADL